METAITKELTSESIFGISNQTPTFIAVKTVSSYFHHDGSQLLFFCSLKEKELCTLLPTTSQVRLFLPKNEEHRVSNSDRLVDNPDDKTVGGCHKHQLNGARRGQRLNQALERLRDLERLRIGGIQGALHEFARISRCGATALLINVDSNLLIRWWTTLPVPKLCGMFFQWTDVDDVSRKQTCTAYAHTWALDAIVARDFTRRVCLALCAPPIVLNRKDLWQVRVTRPVALTSSLSLNLILNLVYSCLVHLFLPSCPHAIFSIPISQILAVIWESLDYCRCWSLSRSERTSQNTPDKQLQLMPTYGFTKARMDVPPNLPLARIQPSKHNHMHCVELAV